jgi:membrane protein DedA with SNARE-associated domain
MYGLALLLAGLCMPISSDFVLLTAGYLAYQGQADYGILIPIAIIAILLGDTIMFFLGQRFGKSVIRFRVFRKTFTPERVDRVEASFNQHGYRVVFFARFMPGIRTVFMVLAGTLGLRYWKFLIYNFIGALIVVPGITYSVKWIAGNVEAVHEKLGRGQWIVMAILGVCVFAAYLRNRLKRL